MAWEIDLFASEYGWTIDRIMETPPDQKAELIHAIFYRKGLCPQLVENGIKPGSLADMAAAIFDTATS